MIMSLMLPINNEIFYYNAPIYSRANRKILVMVSTNYIIILFPNYKACKKANLRKNQYDTNER